MLKQILFEIKFYYPLDALFEKNVLKNRRVPGSWHGAANKTHAGPNGDFQVDNTHVQVVTLKNGSHKLA